jgi:hypothetical protein
LGAFDKKHTRNLKPKIGLHYQELYPYTKKVEIWNRGTDTIPQPIKKKSTISCGRAVRQSIHYRKRSLYRELHSMPEPDPKLSAQGRFAESK